MSKNHFDYIIVGNGMAGLQLALALANEDFFENKCIALVDPLPKTANDKTWCFWEKGIGKWDEIVYKSWSTSRFISNSINISKSLDPYQYKMIRSIDFYNYAKNNLSRKENFCFIKDEIMDIKIHKDTLLVEGKHQEYSCVHAFDSRIPNKFYTDTKSVKLIQHFKGYVIETEKNTFDSDEFIMMDYRLRYKDSTSFNYVLPLSSKKALVEFTFFNDLIVDDSVYDAYLQNYIENYLKISQYNIIETEKGQIPMSTYNFAKHNNSYITKIGTGGGWVKGSTGYSFKNTEKKVCKILENLGSNRIPSRMLSKRKYNFYDQIFLRVLRDYNHEGVEIFEKFYSKNKVNDYFAFLDEESTLVQEIKIMLSLYSSSFIKSLYRYTLGD